METRVGVERPGGEEEKTLHRRLTPAARHSHDKAECVINQWLTTAVVISPPFQRPTLLLPLCPDIPGMPIPGMLVLVALIFAFARLRLAMSRTVFKWPVSVHATKSAVPPCRRQLLPLRTAATTVIDDYAKDCAGVAEMPIGPLGNGPQSYPTGPR